MHSPSDSHRSPKRLTARDIVNQRLMTGLIVWLAMLAGCKDSAQTPGASSKLKVVCTVGMVADIARNVGGEHIEVVQLLGSGVDPHMHAPNRDDVSQLMNADVIFYSGLKLEGKMGDTLEKLGASQTVVAITDSLAQRRTLSNADESGQHADPHVWMDVSLWSDCVGSVVDTLCKASPAHEDQFQAAATEYQERLAALHNYGREKIRTIPEENRVLITSHDAFSYFGSAYGIEVMGVQGISTESEAGLQRINALVDTIVDRNIKAIFAESSVASKSIEALAEGAGRRGQSVIVSPSPLYSDAMGKTGTYEGTYIGMLDHNITVVTRALGGQAPELGMQGKLAGEASAVAN